MSRRCIFNITFISFLASFIALSPVLAETISPLDNNSTNLFSVNENYAKEMLAKGQVHWKRGDLDKAVKTLEEVVELEPSNNQATKILKGMQIQRNRIDNLLKNVIDSNRLKFGKK